MWFSAPSSLTLPHTSGHRHVAKLRAGRAPHGQAAQPAVGHRAAQMAGAVCARTEPRLGAQAAGPVTAAALLPSARGLSDAGLHGEAKQIHTSIASRTGYAMEIHIRISHAQQCSASPPHTVQVHLLCIPLKPPPSRHLLTLFSPTSPLRMGGRAPPWRATSSCACKACRCAARHSGVWALTGRRRTPSAAECACWAMPCHARHCR